MGLTVEGLTNPFTINDNPYTFSTWVIDVLKMADSCVDAPGDGKKPPAGSCLIPGDFDTPAAHCDDEDILGCSDRVKEFKTNAIDAIKGKNYQQARLTVGRALHTVQDVYAHTNWADLEDAGYIGLSPIYLEDGVSPYQGYKPKDMGLVDTDMENKTCNNWHRKLSSYTIYDLYDPRGWEYHDGILAELGGRGKAQLTSGWYAGAHDIIDGVSVKPPPILFKCDHGLFSDTGLAKDWPEHPHFDTARDYAVVATRHFIYSVLRDPSLSDEDVRKFMGIAGGDVNIGFAVDTTGSMGDTIAGVKSAISKVVADIKAGKKTVSNFSIMSYGDPGIGNVTTVKNADQMQAEVDKVTLMVPDWGGDCPEQSTAALLKMVNAAPNNTDLFIYTDASTHQPELADQIITTAKSKQMGINFFVSGDCTAGWVGFVPDPSYTKIATATGGGVFKYEHSVAGAEGTFAQINPKFKGNLQDASKVKTKLPPLPGAKLAAVSSPAKSLASTNMGAYTSADGNAAYHILPPPVVAKASVAVVGRPAAKADGNSSAEHSIKVDSSTTGLTVAVDMAPLGIVKLYRPDGTEVASGDAGVTITTSSVGVTFNVDSPVVGGWKLYVEGTPEADYSYDVQMNSEVSLISFAFTEVKGRPGHEGMFEISGQPLATEDQAFVLNMGGSVETAELVIASLDGKDLGTADLTNEGGALGAAKFSGVIKLPTQDFRVYVRGKDKNGKDYQRLYPQVYHGQSVKVDAQAGEYDVTAGRKVKASFKVQNKGVGDNFAFTATNSLNYPMTLSSTEETLDTDGMLIVSVDIDIPADAAANTTFDVTLKAQSKTNVDSANTATNKFIVAADTDGDGISDYTEKGGSVNDESFDGNGDGTPDWKQANVASFTAIDASPITLEVSKGTLSKARATADPSNGEDKVDKADFPMGYLDFSIAGLAAGDESVLKIHYPASATPSKYYKFGPTAASATPAWYVYSNAKIEPGLTTVTLKDGQDGDSDLTANGTIVDPGGLGFIPNTRPVANADAATTKQDTPVTTGNVLANDTDADGDVLTINAVDATSAQGGTVVNNGNGTFTYTPKAGFVGTDTFTYSVSDGNGGSATATVTVTVQSDGRGNGSGSGSGGGGSTDAFSLFALFSLLMARMFGRKKTV